MTDSVLAAMETLRRVQASGGALMDQAQLHAQLARVEWAQERRRLLRLLLVLLLGFAFVLGAMFSAGALLVALSWPHGYGVEALGAMLLAYAIGVSLAWLRLRALVAQGDATFAASREELAADVQLLRERA